jgi:hypothetical protein
MQRNDKNGRTTTTKDVVQSKELTWDIPSLKCCKDEEEIVQRWGGDSSESVSSLVCCASACAREMLGNAIATTTGRDNNKNRRQTPKVRTLSAQATRSFDLVAAESSPGKGHDPYFTCMRSCVRNQAGTQ